jgi:hypothetical protein
VIGDVAVRAMSEREQRRAGTAAAHAMNEIYARLVAGDKETFRVLAPFLCRSRENLNVA